MKAISWFHGRHQYIYYLTLSLFINYFRYSETSAFDPDPTEIIYFWITIQYYNIVTNISNTFWVGVSISYINTQCFYNTVLIWKDVLKTTNYLKISIIVRFKMVLENTPLLFSAQLFLYIILWKGITSVYYLVVFKWILFEISSVIYLISHLEFWKCF